jgi:hypothetical protein
MNRKIYAPNIHLFAFQLHKKSDEQHLLWQKCDEVFTKLNVRASSNQASEILKLTTQLNFCQISGDQRCSLLKDATGKIFLPFEFKSDIAANHLEIKGFAFPLQIYDSYALWLNLRRPENEDNQKTENVDIEILGKLNPGNCLDFRDSHPFLGQTLLVTVWLTDEQKQSQNQKYLQELADQCLEELIPQASQRPSLGRTGQLFDSPIFEYGLFSQISNYCHVLVWLFRQEETDKKFVQCSQNQLLLDLFFYRTKVIKAYEDSRYLHQEIERSYSDIEMMINAADRPQAQDERLSERELAALKKQLKKLPQTALQYANLLRILEEYSNTISINTYDYENKLQQIKKIYPDDDFDFLEIFAKTNSPYFQQQIRADINYFIHGEGLLEKKITSIRGTVEIEQAERDRLRDEREKQRDLQLQLWVGAVGFGLAVSGITSQVEPRPLEAICSQLPSIKSICSQLPLKGMQPNNSTNNLVYTSINVVFHIVIGLIFGVVAYFLLRLIFQGQLRGRGNNSANSGN